MIYVVALSGGKVNARLREPCANDINSCGGTRRLSINHSESIVSLA
jgi:hypothetical protein